MYQRNATNDRPRNADSMEGKQNIIIGRTKTTSEKGEKSNMEVAHTELRPLCATAT